MEKYCSAVFSEPPIIIISQRNAQGILEDVLKGILRLHNRLSRACMIIRWSFILWPSLSASSVVHGLLTPRTQLLETIKTCSGPWKRVKTLWVFHEEFFLGGGDLVVSLEMTIVVWARNSILMRNVQWWSNQGVWRECDNNKCKLLISLFGASVKLY